MKNSRTHPCGIFEIFFGGQNLDGLATTPTEILEIYLNAVLATSSYID